MSMFCVKAEWRAGVVQPGVPHQEYLVAEGLDTTVMWRV